MAGKEKSNYRQRLNAREEELHALYESLYGQEGYDLLLASMEEFYRQRPADLRILDKKREQDPQWYLRQDMLGMTMYCDRFAGGLKGLAAKLDYLEEQHITYLHLMPLMKMPHPENDGGYAVEDFRQVDPQIGTNEDLEMLTAALRQRGISLCLDLVMNHTADTHDWAMRAKAGDPEYIFRYETYETYDIPAQYEPYIPQVFPTTAPGSFIWNEEMHRFVMSSFYPYQWDLNYKNPTVFREMAGNALFMANMGVEVIRIDAVPYIWKQPGTSCRNLPQVHTILRMLRLITEIVCPAVILKGEVVMAPKELPPYFGTPEKPECHLLYGATTMVNLWSALAARDTRLLKAHADAVHSLPQNCRFVNYLRCHDDIGWGLDEEQERRLGIDPILHKEYLFRFYEGTFPGSFARGELYNFDPSIHDARNCGTTASLCGVEKAGFEGDEEQMKTAAARDLLMHAACMSLQGFPMLSSGDEIGQVNDYSYKENPETAADSRFIHRSTFSFENAAKRDEPGTVQYEIYSGLRQMEEIRRSEETFGETARVTTWDTGCREVFALRRTTEKEELLCLANFSEYERTACLPCLVGTYEDLFDHTACTAAAVEMGPYRYRWLKKKREGKKCENSKGERDLTRTDKLMKGHQSCRRSRHEKGRKSGRCSCRRFRVGYHCTGCKNIKNKKKRKGESEMKQFNYVVTDPVGIHARPAGLLAKEAKQCGDAVVTITKGEKTVKASQLMMLMGLGVKQGDTVTVAAEGPDEEAAIAKMEAFFKENL